MRYFAGLLKRLRMILPIVYCVIAVGAWVDFARLPPDGLASLGLWLVVFPIALLDIALRPSNAPGSSVFMPDGHGYYGNHAIFFTASVFIIALLLYALGAAMDRQLAKLPRPND
jgi:hypothetical protein